MKHLRPGLACAASRCWCESDSPGSAVTLTFSAQATGLLLACYVGSAVLAVMNPTLFRAPVMAGGHLLLGAGLVAQTFVLDRAKYTPDAIQAFYRFIWTLFYSEYFLWTFC